jgi:hypothetical protein
VKAFTQQDEGLHFVPLLMDVTPTNSTRGVYHMTTSEYTLPIITTPPVHIVLMEDEELHTPDHPFCPDVDCPCKDDPELVREYVMEPLARHQLNGNQAMAIYWGRLTPAEAAAIIARIQQQSEVA